MRPSFTVRVAVGLAAAGLLAPPALTASSASAALPPARPPVAQPVAAEEIQPYVPQASCEPKTRKGVAKFRDLMTRTYGRGANGGTTRACAGAGRSEHVEGRAWDWMLNAKNKKDKKVADHVLKWLLAKGPDGQPALQARRLGIMYVMYDGRIWGVWSQRWEPIRKGSHQHTDHIHFSFSWAGARGKTSFWTGKVGAVDYGPCAAYRNQPARLYTKPNRVPCPQALPKAPRSTHPLRLTGSSGPHVAQAQALLRVPASQRSAVFGTTLRKAVVAFQRKHRLPVTGALDKATWVRLDPRSRVGSGPIPAPAPIPSPVPAPAPTPTPAPGVAAPTSWVTLRHGSSGPAVVRLQTALELAPSSRTGWFGPITEDAVRAHQRSHDLAVDGVVGPLTARSLGLIA